MNSSITEPRAVATGSKLAVKMPNNDPVATAPGSVLSAVQTIAELHQYLGTLTLGLTHTPSQTSLLPTSFHQYSNLSFHTSLLSSLPRRWRATVRLLPDGDDRTSTFDRLR